MSDNKIIETLNNNSIAHLLLGANLLLLWIPIYTFIPNPKITYYGGIYLLFILGGTSYKTIKRLFAFPGSVSVFSYFEKTRFILIISSLTFFLLWIFKNLEVAYLFYSVLIILVILVYFFEIIMYPKILRNKTYKHHKNNEQWRKQEANAKLREQQRWNSLSSEGKCNEICRDIKNNIESDYLNDAHFLLDKWREEIIDLKGNSYFNDLINSYNNRIKQNRRENSREYNWLCSKCGLLVKQNHKPSANGKCNNDIFHNWGKL